MSMSIAGIIVTALVVTALLANLAFRASKARQWLSFCTCLCMAAVVLYATVNVLTVPTPSHGLLEHARLSSFAGSTACILWTVVSIKRRHAAPGKWLSLGLLYVTISCKILGESVSTPAVQTFAQEATRTMFWIDAFVAGLVASAYCDLLIGRLRTRKAATSMNNNTESEEVR